MGRRKENPKRNEEREGIRENTDESVCRVGQHQQEQRSFGHFDREGNAGE